MTRNRIDRGYLLIAIIFISLILLVMGMCFLSIKVLKNQEGILMAFSSQAGAVAEAGMEEAKLKLEKDQDFPPLSADDQTTFTYCEELFDLDGTTSLGSYIVTVDTSRKNPPYLLITVSVIGTAGAIDKPFARRKLKAELDISPMLRSNPSVSNPHYFKYINWQDSGSL